jgi:hypothetical protein
VPEAHPNSQENHTVNDLEIPVIASLRGSEEPFVVIYALPKNAEELAEVVRHTLTAYADALGGASAEPKPETIVRDSEATVAVLERIAERLDRDAGPREVHKEVLRTPDGKIAGVIERTIA